jgi:hypothetical protein
MLIRLGGLSLPAMEMGCRDLSLLTPEEQDRVWELFRKVATHFKALNRASPSKRFQSYIGLLAKVPTCPEALLGLGQARDAGHGAASRRGIRRDDGRRGDGRLSAEQRGDGPTDSAHQAE